MLDSYTGFSISSTQIVMYGWYYIGYLVVDSILTAMNWFYEDMEKKFGNA